MTDSKIVDHGEVDPRELVANPKNWRRHPPSQEAVLNDVLEEVGWVQEVIVNRTTGLLVDGHLRVKLAVKRGENSIPVSYVELTEAEEEMVLATLDPIVGMARADREKQEEINERVREGVGGERAALRALLEAETARSGKGEKPRHEITAELLESHNYVVLYFDNDLDWNVAQQVLGIEPKEALDSREGYRRAGIGRVIRGAPVIERLQGGGTDADNDDAG